METGRVPDELKYFIAAFGDPETEGVAEYHLANGGGGYAIIEDGSDDLGSAIEDTLNRFSDCGLDDEQIYKFTGLVNEFDVNHNGEIDRKHSLDIDKGYVIPTEFKTLRDNMPFYSPEECALPDGTSNQQVDQFAKAVESGSVSLADAATLAGHEMGKDEFNTVLGAVSDGVIPAKTAMLLDKFSIEKLGAYCRQSNFYGGVALPSASAISERVFNKDYSPEQQAALFMNSQADTNFAKMSVSEFKQAFPTFLKSEQLGPMAYGVSLGTDPKLACDLALRGLNGNQLNVLIGTGAKQGVQPEVLRTIANYPNLSPQQMSCLAVKSYIGASNEEISKLAKSGNFDGRLSSKEMAAVRMKAIQNIPDFGRPAEKSNNIDVEARKNNAGNVGESDNGR